MSMPIKQKIFWFQISIDDLSLMKVLECESNFSSIELRYRIGKALDDELVKDSYNQNPHHTCDFRNSENSSPPSTKSITMYKFFES